MRRSDLGARLPRVFRWQWEKAGNQAGSASPFWWCCSRRGVAGSVRQDSWGGAAPSGLTMEPALEGEHGPDGSCSWN